MLIRIERPSEGTEKPIEVSLAHQSKSDRTRRALENVKKFRFCVAV